ncbi:MAG TPA: phosphate ABC transporter permease PstA [Tepidisphaeraceae bacterium]|jgi:phosphate transport system permease protein|nr:phosphate ABC transporter permease PstA [Tepidisphaeraceae bacterium]
MDLLRNPQARSVHDRLGAVRSSFMYATCIVFTLFVVAMLATVTGYLIWTGIGSINWAFFTQLPIPRGMEGYPGGMKNALVGTGVLILLASLVGIPIGMLTGVYLAEYETGSWLASPVRFIADVLAGVPSIVVGILGYELLVRPIGAHNAWAGAMALAFIMIPIVARTTEEMLRLVPQSYREASIALGASKAMTILTVVLPSATGSVVTGVMLAIARVAGETAPLLFTALISAYMPRKFEDLNNPFPSLTVEIFKDATDVDPQLQRQAWAGIVVLVGMIFILNLAIRFFARRRT